MALQEPPPPVGFCSEGSRPSSEVCCRLPSARPSPPPFSTSLYRRGASTREPCASRFVVDPALGRPGTGPDRRRRRPMARRAIRPGSPVLGAEARTLLVMGRVLRRDGKRAPARAALTESLDLFSDIGAPRWATRAQAELHRLGRRSSGGDALTATEARVAELAAPRALQPGDSRPGIHLRQDRRGQPDSLLPQARRPLPCRARQRAG